MASQTTVAIVGAGTMGTGLAVQFARHGNDVTLVDHRQSNLDEARRRIVDAVDLLADESLTTLSLPRRYWETSIERWIWMRVCLTST